MTALYNTLCDKDAGSWGFESPFFSWQVHKTKDFSNSMDE